jgi:hypothetical protein
VQTLLGWKVPLPRGQKVCVDDVKTAQLSSEVPCMPQQSPGPVADPQVPSLRQTPEAALLGNTHPAPVETIEHLAGTSMMPL